MIWSANGTPSGVQYITVHNAWQIVGERRYALYLISGLGTPGVVAAHGRTGRWSLSRETPLHTRRLAMLDGAEITGLIRRAAGAGLDLVGDGLTVFAAPADSHL